MQKIRSLQALRAVAACSVVYSHAFSRADRTWPDSIGSSVLSGIADLAYIGHFGVDLFFILSGFLMMSLHADAFHTRGAPLDFMIRRIVRVVPIYWLLTTLGAVLLVVAPRLFSYHKGIELDWLAGSYLFVPWPQEDGFSSPVIGAGWTLDFEMYFYVVFASALFLRRQLALPLIAGLFIISIAVGMAVSPVHPWLALLTSPLLSEFLLGMLVARMVYRFQPPPAFSGTAIAASIAVIFASGWFFPHGESARVTVWGIPSAVLLASVIWLEADCRGRIGRLLVTVGDASYSIYLLQVFALPGSAFALRAIKAERFLGVDAMIFIVWLASCASGYVFWRIAERPITQFIQARLKSRAMRNSQPATAAVSADLR